MTSRFSIHGAPHWTRATWQRALDDFAELESRDTPLAASAAALGTAVGSCCVFRRALEIWGGERVA